MPQDLTKKAIRKSNQAKRQTVRVQKRQANAIKRVVSSGSRMVDRGKALSGRTTKQSMAETSRLRKKGQVGSGPSKRIRYRAMDAQVKIQSGRDMMKNPEKYAISRRGVSRGAKRTASSGPQKSRIGTTTRVNRYGNPTKRKN